MTYEEALTEWVKRQGFSVADGAHSFDFKVEHSEGYAYSSWTYESGYTRITLTYKVGDDQFSHNFYEFDDDAEYDLGRIVREVTEIAAESS